MLLPDYDFYQWNNEKLAIASQFAGIPAVFSISKLATTLIFLKQVNVISYSSYYYNYPRFTIFTNRKVETDICDKPNILANTIPIFTMKKAKTAKDTLNEKASVASTPLAATPTLEFS